MLVFELKEETLLQRNCMQVLEAVEMKIEEATPAIIQFSAPACLHLTGFR